jgi:hypothetical protein
MKTVIGLDLTILLRWILGLLLVWAAVSKLANLQDFYASARAYRMPLPDALLRAAVITLPWLELLCGLMLLAKFRVEAALGWAMILFGIFALATGQAWARGLDIGCGCFHLDLPFFAGEGKASFARFMESPAFAFFRALLLFASAVWLFRARTPATAAVSPSGMSR